MFFRFSKRQGFTLIELLVVIAIISLISSVVMSSVSSARKRARDARRVSELDQFIKAMELYYNDYNVYAGSGDGGGAHFSSKCSSDLKDDLVGGGYLPQAMSDPLDADCADNSDGAFFYGWDSGHCCEGSYCISINTLETQWAVDLLTQKFGKMNYVTGGGDANIGTGDHFNHCFVEN